MELSFSAAFPESLKKEIRTIAIADSLKTFNKDFLEKGNNFFLSVKVLHHTPLKDDYIF